MASPTTAVLDLDSIQVEDGFNPRQEFDEKNLEVFDAFLARLDRMTPEERVRASRYSFTSWERRVWAGRYPDDVPLINGEVEWIALRSVDCE